MAKIEMIHSENDGRPASIETLEVRVWGLGGTQEQLFYLGRGLNYQANRNFWLEILYSANHVPFFYTRNYIQQLFTDMNFFVPLASRLDKIELEGEGDFRFGDSLPDTRLRLFFDKTIWRLEISLDTGSMFGRSTPGDHAIKIQIDDIELPDGVRFMRDLTAELKAVSQGLHPDPASFPEGSSEWPFVWQLNRKAYDQISEIYQEQYFENPLLTEGFDGWLTQLPPGGNILDAGCGHGQPVMARLLEKGFQVIGSDISPVMLRRAGQRFPQAQFLHQATTALTHQAAFDGICSFSSLLYLDPIDFLNSIHRLHRALKPGGLLFLYAYDSAPGWRGIPYHTFKGQWIWAWHYGMQEAARLLAEHGYFEVIATREVAVDEEEEQRMAMETEKQKEEEEAYRQKLEKQPAGGSTVLPPIMHSPTTIARSPYAYVIIARRLDR